MDRTLDRTDWRILEILQKDGRAAVNAIAEKVNLTKSPCLARMRRLEQEGYIRGYRAEIDPAMVQQDYIVFVQVKLTSTTETVLRTFNEAVRDIPEIQSCHLTAGGFDYLLKVRTAGMSDYRALLGEVISGLPGVQQTSTFPVMEEIKDAAILRLKGAEPPRAGRKRQKRK